MRPCLNDKSIRATFFLSLVAATLIATSRANATDGAYVVGNGPMSSGVAGTSIAMPQDSLVAADNPAGMAYVGERIDAYIFLLSARINSTFGSTSNHFFSSINSVSPGFGFTIPVNSRWTYGVSVTGAGLAIRYNSPVMNIPGIGNANDSLIEVNMAPTVTYKIRPNLSVGASMMLGIQQFRASGLLGTDSAGDTLVLSNHSNSYATGVGGSFGVLWSLNSFLSLGASYFSPMKFSRLSGYKDDLLASTGGSIDMPSRYGAGIAIHPLQDLTVGIDYVRIDWADTSTLGNPSTFNWHSQNVVRFGVIYQATDRVKLRAGFNHANAYVDAYHTLANFYTPGIPTNAITAGFTYALSKHNQVSFSAEYDPPTTINGKGSSSGTNIHNSYQLYNFGYTHLF